MSLSQRPDAPRPRSIADGRLRSVLRSTASLAILAAAMAPTGRNASAQSICGAASAPMRRRQKFPASFGALVATIGLVFAPPALAAGTTWNDGAADWATSANWSLGVAPTAADDAFIDNGGTAQVTTAGDTALTLTLGTAAGNSGTVTIDGASALLKT